MKRSITTIALFALLVPALLPAQVRPDVLAAPDRDTAALNYRERLSKARAYAPQITLWSPNADRFDYSDLTPVFVSVDRNAYVAVFEVGTDGRVRVIHPRTPRENMLVQAGTMQRVLAGAGFYPDIPGSRVIPYVFALASVEPFDLSEFGQGSRWRYQYAAGAGSRSPEYAIRHVASMIFGQDDIFVSAEYLYFATRAQVRQVNALRALDSCGGLGWERLSYADIGSDFFFRNFFIPMWELYVPFSSFYNSVGFIRPDCGRARYQTFATNFPTLPTPAAPTPSTPVQPPAGGVDPQAPGEHTPAPRDKRDRRKAENSEDERNPGLARVAGISPINTTTTAAPEPLRERRDYVQQRREEQARESLERRERWARESGPRTIRERASDDRPSSATSSPASSAPAPAAPAPAPAPRPEPREASGGGAEKPTGVREKDPR
jgi:hypothetical protein